MATQQILVLVDWYLPGYKAGGPIQSTANLIAHLGDDFDFYVLTSDTDFMADKPYDNITPNTWNKLPNGTPVYYLSKDQMTRDNIHRLMAERPYDVFYLNSFFSKPFTIDPLLIRQKHFPDTKVVLAPRGMLAVNALKIKWLKKRLYLLWAKWKGLYNGITWHASTEHEAQEIHAVMGKEAKVTIAMNLLSKQSITWRQKKKTVGEARFCFVSRITSKKNLVFAITLFEGMERGDKVCYDIYGPVHDEVYWEDCEEAMEEINGHAAVSYKGIVPNDALAAVYADYHFMLLPTKNENFGHAIIEAMSFGCPVVLSTETPWTDLQAKQCGFAIDLDDVAGFREALETCIAMDQATFDVWSRKAFEFAQALRNDPQSVEQNRLLFS